MTVTVVVAARDNAATLARCLDALQAQDHDRLDVIVVDDGSTDDTAAIARAAGVRVIVTQAVGASAARNLGIDAAGGDVIAFTDGDCVVERGWARALVDGLEATGATGVGGRQVNEFPPGRQQLRDGFEAFFRLASLVSDYTRNDGRPRAVAHNPSCCSAYRAEALRAVGGFTPGLWPGEDVDLDLRLARRGATFYYIPGAVVHHHRPGTFAWFRRMMRRYGEATRRLGRLHGRVRPIDHVPTVTTVWLAAHALLLVPSLRPWVIGADAVLAAVAIVAIAVVAPVRQWPVVLAFAVTAIWDWHRGWWTARPLDVQESGGRATP